MVTKKLNGSPEEIRVEQTKESIKTFFGQPVKIWHVMLFLLIGSIAESARQEAQNRRFLRKLAKQDEESLNRISRAAAQLSPDLISARDTAGNVIYLEPTRRVAHG